MDKRPLSLAKLRKVPSQFSWVDQRLVRERYIDHLSHPACALYLFLVTVADAQGLSFYSEQSLCQRLSIELFLNKPTVSPLLPPVSSRNTLLLQSLPTNTPFWQVNSRRRKDGTCVGTAARGIVERLSRLPRRLPSDGGSSG